MIQLSKLSQVQCFFLFGDKLLMQNFHEEILFIYSGYV